MSLFVSEMSIHVLAHFLLGVLVLFTAGVCEIIVYSR